MYNNTTKKIKCKTKNKEKQNLEQGILTIAIFFTIFAILSNPTFYATSVTNGLKLFTVAVLPGLLPFMFLTKIIANMNYKLITNRLDKPARLIGLNGHTLYAFFISIISGYPVGSKYISEIYSKNKISNNQLYKASLLCSTSGPIFIIGTVGVFMLNNITFGIIFYIINILSALLSVIIINYISQNRKKYDNKEIISYNISNKNNKTDDHNIFSLITKSSKDTAESLLTVAFYIAFFYMFIDMLTNLKIISFLSIITGKSKYNITLTGLFSGLIEMTRGIQILSCHTNVISLSIISFLLSFGGFSIILQSISFLQNTSLKIKNFILGKTFQGIISFAISFLTFSIII